MTHWFDRLARTAAEDEPGMTRRGALAGAAVMALAAGPLSSRATAHATLPIRAKAAADGCRACLNGTIRAHNAAIRRCDKYGSIWGPAPSGRRGKGRRKAPPVSAAKKLACALEERKEVGHDLNLCRTLSCQGPSAPPVELAPSAPGCPGGTYDCGNGLCCYGTDVCCGCAGNSVGPICCIIEVGCTCCPA